MVYRRRAVKPGEVRMRFALWLCLLLAAAPPVHAQAALQPQSTTPPTLEQVRADMGIPSRSLELRGQRDSIGFAWSAAQMAKVWELSATPPAPESLGVVPPPGVVGVICPHDDYLFAGRVYRRVLPLITARTVVLVGVFHRYRRFGEHDRLVFDPYRAWRTPDGPVRISPLREELLSHLDPKDYVQSAAMHDSEHSLEALVYWLHHLRPDLEIVPIIVPASSFERLGTLADRLSGALRAAMMAHEWRLGSDVAIAISTDGVHYGPDFRYVPYGDGGVTAYEQATANDRRILAGPLSGPLTIAKVHALYATFVNPEKPDDYRLTWCGRFAVPMGLLLLERMARDVMPLRGYPIAYSTSIGAPELPIRDIGLGPTAPSNLYHFVSYPAVAFTFGRFR
jgi:AmmeMemoRadiSam system protein B